ncbi:MAG: hypothetical protein NC231_15350, partial [Bacillus sp. (in: Bacteria)]|nr:hypothetical protein [Bacillus sp. (in: firmicutes)]
MEFSEYYIQSNNGKKFSKRDLEKSINREQLGVSAFVQGTDAEESNHLSLFDKLDMNKDGKLDKGELDILFKKLTTYATKNGDNVLDEYEAQAYLDELDGFFPGVGNQLRGMGVSASDLITFVQKVIESPDMTGANEFQSKVLIPYEVKGAMPKREFSEEQMKEFAVKNLREMYEIMNGIAEQSDADLDAELSEIGFKFTDLLLVPFVYRQVKRTNKKDAHESNALTTRMLLDAQAKSIEFLEKSLSEEGLTYREYYGFKKECLKSALIASGWSATDKSLDARLDSVTFEGLDVLAAKCLEDPAGTVKMFKAGTEEPETQTRLIPKINGDMLVKSPAPKMVPRQAAYDERALDELVPFEKVFRDVRGQEYEDKAVKHFLAVESMLYYAPLDKERELAYQKESSGAYLKAFGQPERELFTSIKADNTRADLKLRTAVMDGSGQEVTELLKMGESGNKHYVVPDRDLLAEAVPLSEEQLQNLGGNILYNLVSPAASMLNQYYEDTKNHLLDGNATRQGFRIWGKLLTFGNIDTIHDDLAKINDLNLKAIHLTTTRNPESFKKLFKDITGQEYSVEKMQELANLIQLGEAPDSEKYKSAVKSAFGLDLSNLVSETESSVNTQRQAGQITGIVQMIAVTGGLGELAVFKNAASASMAAFGELGGSMVAGAMNMGTYEALMETGNVIGRSVYNKKSPTMADLEGVVKNTAHGMAFGAAAGVVHKFMVNPVMKKIDPKIQTRALEKVDKMLGKGSLLTGTELLTTIQKTSPLLIAQTGGFLAEVAGFTGYSVLEKAFTDIVTGDFKLPDTEDNLELVKAFFEYIGETFDEQFETLGTIKGLGQLLQFMRGGKVAMSGIGQRMKDTGLDDVTIKERVGEDGKKSYLMTYKDGSYKQVSSLEEAVGRLNAQLNGKKAQLILADLVELLDNNKKAKEAEPVVEVSTTETPKTTATVAEAPKEPVAQEPVKPSKPVSEMTEAEMIERYSELSKTGIVGEELLTLTLELQEKGYRFGQDGRLDFAYNPN